MAGSESILPALDQEETLDDFDEDVDMLDAEIDEPEPATTQAESTRSLHEGKPDGQERQGVKNSKRKRKKNKKKNKPSSDSVTNINRFVIDTCRHLKEKKSYLVWNAVGCLGVSAMRELVKEVDTIQTCGGQLTADGKRFRNGGGILWNILKTREPKVYKEIMKKGKEFEKQFRQPYAREGPRQNREACPFDDKNASEGAADKTSSGTQTPLDSKTQESAERSREGVRVPILNRIRVPVTYDDDLLEEDAKENASES